MREKGGIGLSSRVAAEAQLTAHASRRILQVFLHLFFLTQALTLDNNLLKLHS